MHGLIEDALLQASSVLGSDAFGGAASGGAARPTTGTGFWRASGPRTALVDVSRFTSPVQPLQACQGRCKRRGGADPVAHLAGRMRGACTPIAALIAPQCTLWRPETPAPGPSSAAQRRADCSKAPEAPAAAMQTSTATFRAGTAPRVARRTPRAPRAVVCTASLKEAAQSAVAAVAGVALVLVSARDRGRGQWGCWRRAAAGGRASQRHCRLGCSCALLLPLAGLFCLRDLPQHQNACKFQLERCCCACSRRLRHPCAFECWRPAPQPPHAPLCSRAAGRRGARPGGGACALHLRGEGGVRAGAAGEGSSCSCTMPACLLPWRAVRCQRLLALAAPVALRPPASPMQRCCIARTAPGPLPSPPRAPAQATLRERGAKELALSSRPEGAAREEAKVPAFKLRCAWAGGGGGWRGGRGGGAWLVQPCPLVSGLDRNAPACCWRCGTCCGSASDGLCVPPALLLCRCCSASRCCCRCATPNGMRSAPSSLPLLPPEAAAPTVVPCGHPAAALLVHCSLHCCPSRLTCPLPLRPAPPLVCSGAPEKVVVETPEGVPTPAPAAPGARGACAAGQGSRSCAAGPRLGSRQLRRHLSLPR